MTDCPILRQTGYVTLLAEIEPTRPFSAIVIQLVELHRNWTLHLHLKMYRVDRSNQLSGAAYLSSTWVNLGCNYFWKLDQYSLQINKNFPEGTAVVQPGLTSRRQPSVSTKTWVSPANARRIGDTLLIPLRNIDGHLRNIQRINPAGKRRFLKDEEVTGRQSLT
jgi:hypothetical protein